MDNAVVHCPSLIVMPTNTHRGFASTLQPRPPTCQFKADDVVAWTFLFERGADSGGTMSQIVDFYRGLTIDTEGRLLQDLWNWDDESLEVSHDFIQWMLPLRDPSQFNPDAPICGSRAF